MKKAVIIGGGPAGLTAGYELLKNKGEFEVVLLEETQEFGGISRTVRYNGNRMDIGGHRFFSKSKRVTDWWYEILSPQGAPAVDDKMLSREVPLVRGGLDPEKEDDIMLTRTRVSRIYYKNAFFDYPVTLKWATIKNMGFFTTMNAGFSYLGACMKKLPEENLENFYINRFGRVLYSMFFEGYTEKLWGRPPKQISADWGAQRVKGLSIKAVLKDIFGKMTNSQKEVETSLIESFSYPKFGPGQLWEKTAAKITGMGGDIRKGCKVIGVNNENGTIKSVTYERDGQAYTESADIVISSMPIKDLVNAMNNPPKDIKRIANGLPYRDFITVGLLVNKLKIKNTTKSPTVNNIVPDCWIYVQDGSVKLGRIQIFNNWSPYMVKDFKNKVWIGLEYFCDEGDSMWNMSDKDFTDFAIGELAKIGVIDKEDVVDTHREKVKKAYPAYFDTYSEIDKVIEYLDGNDNLFCVGRNGQHRYNNMDHSMMTAFEVVDAIRKGSNDRKAIWNVNTETEYHEEKKN